MTSKFYLKDAATTDTGTLPGASTQSVTSPTVTATGASTNRSMDGTITGSGNVNATLNSNASKTAQSNWFRRYCSSPIAAQSFDNTWHLSVALAIATANASNSSWHVGGCLYVWRPSGGGSLVGRLYDGATFNDLTSSTAGSSSESWVGETAGPQALSNVSAAAGDILVFELWGFVTQGKATSYQWDTWYDGSTEGSTTSPASYMNLDKDVVMQTLARQPRHPGINHQNPGIL